MPWGSLLLGFGILVIFYFLLIRPQKKRADEIMKAQDSLTSGDRIMLTSGIFATVRAVGKNQMVVELAPGVEVTCVKRAFAQKLSADSEEFEFADDLGDLEPVDFHQSDVLADDDQIADDNLESAAQPEVLADTFQAETSEEKKELIVDEEKPGE